MFWAGPLLLACGPVVDGSSSEGNTASDGGSTDGESGESMSQGASGEGGGNDDDSAGAACDPPPAEGSDCSVPESSCSIGCEDQCSFCNVYECQDGVWKRNEVSPLPCIDCEQMCEYSVPAGCPSGPPDHATCVSGCEDLRVGPCTIEFSYMLACIGEAPAFTCDAAGRPVVATCEQAFADLYACIGI